MNRLLARVNHEDVTKFKESCFRILDASMKLNQSRECIESLFSLVIESEDAIEEVSINICKLKEKYREHREICLTKIDELEMCLSTLNADLERLELSHGLETDPESLEQLRSELERVQWEISEKREELHKEKNKLHEIEKFIQRFENKLRTSLEKRNQLGVINQKVKKTHSEIERIRSDNDKESETAIRLLEKIEDVIQKYEGYSLNLSEVVPTCGLTVSLGTLTLSLSFPWLQNFASILEQEMSLPNETEVVVDKPKEYVDDDGKVYRKDDEILANATFVKNGYEYRTDSFGRTISVSGRLILKNHERRMNDSLEVVGKGAQKLSDDRGHLIGHQFNGSDSLENLIPQDMMINRGTYRTFENSLAEYVETGSDVVVSVNPVYSSNERRPDSIVVLYSIDGKNHIRCFPNERKEIE